jgi:hypothetical protein
MPGTRYKRAWICLAVAAMTIALVARAQSGIQSAKAYTNPVFEFLAEQQSANLVAIAGVARNLNRCSARQTSVVLLRGADSGAWMAMLPILFVGLVSPLSLISPLAFKHLTRTSDAPVLPFSFQRPPPSRLV